MNFRTGALFALTGFAVTNFATSQDVDVSGKDANQKSLRGEAVRHERQLISNQVTRFEKFNFTSTSYIIPFPLTESDITILRQNSNSISVVSGECTGPEIENIIANLGSLYPPSHPEDQEFWTKFAEVANVQRARQTSNALLDVNMPFSSLPKLWQTFDTNQVAEAVHDEFPGVYHGQMITQWLTDKSLKPSSIIPKNGQIDFLRGEVFLSNMVGLAIELVGYCNFSLKWQHGRARPEEIAWKIKNNDLSVPSSVDEDIRTEITEAINAISFDGSATGFTAYPEGSPTHPSWPAMHSASSAASFWLDVVMDLTDEQRCEARKLDYAIAYARTVAGVHYPDDNIAGLTIGQEVLAERLRDYLVTNYDADEGAVREAVKRAKYDWTTFTTSDCYKSGWTIVRERGDFSSNVNGDIVGEGKYEFNTIFQMSPKHIIRRIVKSYGCPSDSPYQYPGTNRCFEYLWGGNMCNIDHLQQIDPLCLREETVRFFRPKADVIVADLDTYGDVFGHDPPLSRTCPTDIPHQYPGNHRCFEFIWDGKTCNLDPANDPLLFQKNDTPCYSNFDAYESLQDAEDSVNKLTGEASPYTPDIHVEYAIYMLNA